MSDLIDLPEYEERDIRPRIKPANTGYLGSVGFAAVVLAGAFMVFNSLEASRAANMAPQIMVPQSGGQGQISSPQPLSVPQRYLADEPRERASRSAVAPRLNQRFDRRELEPRTPPAPRQTPAALIPPTALTPNPERTQTPRPRVVFEAQRSLPAATNRPASTEDNERVTADRFINPSLTIPRGTVIPAVLETALDSTRPGGVRALIQRDISSFDGSRVLIQRGSRLYGEYEADLRSGQNRARIQWTRILRPDGITIALDSPATDPLGRAGVRGKVDSKFLQRFGGSILQSILDIGVNAATREVAGEVFVALPGSTQSVQIQDPEQIQPTLRVKHGTSVSVFVARDLDFSTVE